GAAADDDPSPLQKLHLTGVTPEYGQSSHSRAPVCSAGTSTPISHDKGVIRVAARVARPGTESRLVTEQHQTTACAADDVTADPTGDDASARLTPVEQQSARFAVSLEGEPLTP